MAIPLPSKLSRSAEQRALANSFFAGSIMSRVNEIFVFSLLCDCNAYFYLPILVHPLLRHTAEVVLQEASLHRWVIL